MRVMRPAKDDEVVGIDRFEMIIYSCR
jgi:hypothetical protein